MRKLFKSKKSKSAKRHTALANRTMRGVEALEKRVMLAADFEVVTSGNNIWIEANGDEFDDVFTLEHISQNEVKITIDFEIDSTGDGSADGVDRIIGTYDLDFLEFNAALQSKNFTGIIVNAGEGDDKIDAKKLRHHDDDQFTLNGGDGDDLLIGGRRGDVINGNAGDDAILRADHLDTLSGGSHTGGLNPEGHRNDSVEYGSHSFAAEEDDIPNDDVEWIRGTSHNDSVNASGNTAPVTIIGLAGNDTLTGGSGNDEINGGAGEDLINGNAGNDDIDGGGGDDTINGGEGHDDILGGGGNDTIDGEAGNDTIGGGAGDDNIEGGAGNDKIDGDGGKDHIDGGAGNDSLDGGAGDDSLIGGAGADIIKGGSGEDTADYVGSPTGVAVTVDLQLGVGSGGDAAGDTLPGTEAGTLGTPTGDNDIENVLGPDDAPSTLRGDVDDNTLIGGSEADNIIGRDGDDYLSGLAGDDHIGDDNRAENSPQFVSGSGLKGTFEKGDDTILGGEGNDTLRGGEGLDTIAGDLGDDLIEGDGWYDSNPGSGVTVVHLDNYADTIVGEEGNDRLFASDEKDPFDGDGNNASDLLGTDIVDGGLGDDDLFGSEGSDNLFGDNDLVGGGNDVLFGLLGRDFLYGGNGADTLVGGGGIDLLNGGTGPLDGNDYLEIEAVGAGPFFADLPDFSVNGGSGQDRFNVTGSLPGQQNALEHELDEQDLFINPFDTFSDYNGGGNDDDILDFTSPLDINNF